MTKESNDVHRPAWAQQSHGQVRRRAGDRGTGEGNSTSSPRGKPDRSEETTSGGQSSGTIERAGFLAGQARTLKAALEHRKGTGVPPDARILCVLVDFAAYLMNRCDVGSHGKTPLQGLHGRGDNAPLLELGEKILYMPAKPARGGKWDPRFHPGVFGSMLHPPSEAVVVTKQRLAMKTRAVNVRRIPESERCDADRIPGIRAVPRMAAGMVQCRYWGWRLEIEKGGYGPAASMHEDVTSGYHCGEKKAKLILFHFELIFC